MESTSLANVDDADLDLDDYCLDFGGYDLDPEDYTLHLEDDLDLDDYLKWRNENTHVGLESCTDQALRIWVPETTSFNDKPLRARLRPRKSQGPVFRFLDLPPGQRDLHFCGLLSTNCLQNCATVSMRPCSIHSMGSIVSAIGRTPTLTLPYI